MGQDVYNEYIANRNELDTLEIELQSIESGIITPENEKQKLEIKERINTLRENEKIIFSYQYLLGENYAKHHEQIIRNWASNLKDETKIAYIKQQINIGLINNGTPEQKAKEIVKFFELVDKAMGGTGAKIIAEYSDSEYFAMAGGGNITINLNKIQNIDHLIGYGLEIFVHESVHILQAKYVETHDDHASYLLDIAKKTSTNLRFSVILYNTNVLENEAYASSKHLEGISALWSSKFHN